MAMTTKAKFLYLIFYLQFEFQQAASYVANNKKYGQLIMGLSTYYPPIPLILLVPLILIMLMGVGGYKFVKLLPAH
ncbi:hypothetical protein PN36_16740 [Candidatus Thiomargarita nelsonii]|uniref:Uncharacterized protein n=1 Tax=Candidatus Thiomargarita nelsonii TaxID=1003181 RepID=A0A0A6PCL6_9GAMM|nr:hypothetical protein PN36_16740 [Candidatus Thiomargarita nelsonii]